MGLTPEEIGKTTQAIKYDIGIFLEIKEDIDGDDGAGNIRKLLESGQLSVAFLSGSRAKKFGPFFVESTVSEDDQFVIILCSSMLAYNSASLEKKKRTFDKSIDETKELLRSIHRDGFRLTGDKRIANKLLMQKGLWSPNELGVVFGKN